MDLGGVLRGGGGERGGPEQVGHGDQLRRGRGRPRRPAVRSGGEAPGDRPPDRADLPGEPVQVDDGEGLGLGEVSRPDVRQGRRGPAGPEPGDRLGRVAQRPAGRGRPGRPGGSGGRRSGRSSGPRRRPGTRPGGARPAASGRGRRGPGAVRMALSIGAGQVVGARLVRPAHRADDGNRGRAARSGSTSTARTARGPSRGRTSVDRVAAQEEPLERQPEVVQGGPVVLGDQLAEGVAERLGSRRGPRATATADAGTRPGRSDGRRRAGSASAFSQGSSLAGVDRLVRVEDEPVAPLEGERRRGRPPRRSGRAAPSRRSSAGRGAARPSPARAAGG